MRARFDANLSAIAWSSLYFGPDGLSNVVLMRDIFGPFSRFFISFQCFEQDWLNSPSLINFDESLADLKFERSVLNFLSTY